MIRNPHEHDPRSFIKSLRRELTVTAVERTDCSTAVPLVPHRRRLQRVSFEGGTVERRRPSPIGQNIRRNAAIYFVHNQSTHYMHNLLTPVMPKCRWGTPTEVSAAIVAHRLLSSAMRSNDNDWPVHSLMLSLHDLRCLPLRRLPSTVP